MDNYSSIGKSALKDKANARCETDLTDKTITPMGGFPHYGIVNQDYIMIKGTIPGPIKRPMTIRKQLVPNPSRPAAEQVTLKFIDTSSKFGHGKFQVFLPTTPTNCLLCRLRKRRTNSWARARSQFVSCNWKTTVAFETKPPLSCTSRSSTNLCRTKCFRKTVLSC